MKNTVKRSLSFALALALLLSAWWTVPPAAAAETTGETTVFALSYSGKLPREIQITGSRLTLSGIPGTVDFAEALLVLEDEYGETACSQTAVRDSFGCAEFFLTDLAAGSYTASLYQSAGDGFSQFADGLQLQWYGQQGVFLLSPAYALNQKKATARNSSPQALAYYLRPSPDIQSDNRRIVALATAITAGLEDDYAKALSIHDWVCGELYYDFDALYGRRPYGDQSALAVMDSKFCVCSGYANLTTALLRAAGVPARKVTGYALGSTGGNQFPQSVLDGGSDTNHAWTEAWVNDRWISIDTTWDSPNSGGGISHRYFDIAPELLTVDHAVVYGNNYREMYLYIGYPQYRVGQTWKSYGGHNAAPAVVKGTVMAPVGAIAEEMGARLHWDKTSDPGWEQLIWDIAGYRGCVQLWPGYSHFFVGDKEYKFDVAPRKANGVTMVQVRPLLQAMGYLVDWEDQADGWEGRVTLGYIVP